MSKTKLKNAPLKEVIFELRWECGIDNSGIQIDNGFDLAQGKFADKLKPDFPLHRKLIPEGAPFRIFGAPMHQFWKGEFLWPVIQHGQGMISVNETDKSYQWADHFKPLIISAIKKLRASYDESLKFNKVMFQYIDAWDIDNGEQVDFMKNNLQTEIITNYELPGNLKGFNVQQSFELNDASIMNLKILSGINNQTKKQSVIWTTTVERNGVLSFEEIVQWLETAHSDISKMFKQMLKPEFYASLDR